MNHYKYVSFYTYIHQLYQLGSIRKARTKWVLESQELMIEIRSYTIVGETEQLKDQKGLEKSHETALMSMKKGLQEAAGGKPRR